MSEKLQKVLARAGLGSRREIETWIEEGRLVVNGYPALLGTRVEPKDEVKLDGRRLKLIPEALVNRKILMYHKPEGEVTTRKDPEGRPTVFDRLPPMRGSRWVAIGRLDLNTSGLLLFTNDGEVANRLMHPSHEVEREYAVRILGELKPSQRKKLLEGVLLEDGLAKFNSIESRGGGGSNRWYHVTLSEGRTREVRRMFESMDLVVSRLIRVRYGPVALDPLLKQGMHRELNLEESNRLCEAVGIEPQAPRAERRREYQQTRRSESIGGYGETGDDAFAGERTSASSRKPKVIGSKADELPTDRVERAAELLRRRRAAESAGIEFSGRNGRLSGKRTLRESELRKIAQEKAAEKAGEKAKRPEREEGAEFAGSKPRSRAAGSTAVGRTTPDRSATGRDSSSRATSSRTAGSRSTTGRTMAGRASSGRTGDAGSATGRSETGRTSTTRSPTARTASTRTGASRTGPARASARTERDDDDFAPRRSARPSTRSRDADEEAPRRRSATRSAAAAKPAARSAAGRDERPARSRAAAGSGERAARSSAKPAAAGRSAGARTTATGERSRSAAKPAARSAAGAGKPVRSSTTRSSSARALAPSRGGGSGGGSRSGGKPAGKKRTR